MPSWSFPLLARPSVFIGSPSDVDFLRETARREFDALATGVADDYGVGRYLWEDEASFDHRRPYQANIPLPKGGQCLGAIFLFGERIGSELPADFPRDEFAGSPALASTRHGLAAEGAVGASETTFPLTGSTFEYLVAECADTPRLVLFLGDASLHGDDHVLEQNWGLNQHAARRRHGLKYTECRRWEEEEAIPQRTALRNFFRYIHDRRLPIEIVPSEEAAQERIRRFLTDELRLFKRTGRASPFRGLRAFQRSDSEVFFGRDSIRNEIVERIQRRVDERKADERPFFRLYGASGAGKSSLMLAGVVPRLCHRVSLGNWLDCIARPSDLAAATGPEDRDALIPLYAGCMAAIVSDGGESPETVRAAARDTLADIIPSRRPSRAVEWIVRALDRRSGSERKGRWRLIVGIDQFEECLEELAADSTVDRWRNLIEFVDLATATGRIAAIYTVPLSRLSQMGDYPPLQRLSLASAGAEREVGFPIETVEEIIDRAFAEEGLELAADLRQHLLGAIKALHASARGEDQGAVLPLLSLAMTRIYERWSASRTMPAGGLPPDPGSEPEAPPQESRLAAEFDAGARATAPDAAAHDSERRREPERTCLRLHAYKDLAELASVIDREGEDAIADAKRAARSAVIDEESLPILLRSLVRFMPADSRHFDLRAIAPPRDPSMRALVDALTRHRLLVETADGRLRLVHEAVLRYWKRAASAIDKERARLDYVSGLDRAMRIWEREKRAASAIATLGTPDTERAAEVLYAWASTLAPLSPSEEVSPSNEQLRSFLVAVLAHFASPAEIIGDLESRPTHLHAAVAANARELVGDYLRADPSHARLTRGLDSRTALFDAASMNRSEILEALLQAGAPADQPDKDGWLPLHAAATRGSVRALSILAAHAPDLNAPGGPGHAAPLHSAAGGGHTESAHLLLDRGASVDARDDNQWTPLHWACWSGHDATARLLLDRGADLAASAGGWTSLHLAAQEGHEAVILTLVERGASVDTSLVTGWTPLHSAARAGHEHAVGRLLELGASIDARGSNTSAPSVTDTGGRRDVPATTSDWTPLHVAVDAGMMGVTRVLLSRPGDPNALMSDGRGPLHLAVDKRHAALVETLARHPAVDVDCRDRQGRTALQIALTAASFDIADLLVKAGASVDVAQGEANIKLDQSWSALHFAARDGDAARVEFLVSHRADLEARTADGWTALHVAARYGRDDVLGPLIARGADRDARTLDGSSPLHLAAIDGHLPAMTRLLDAGASPGAGDESGLTPLHVAIEARRVAAAELLLERGAPVSAADQAGWTPLHAAAQNQLAPIVSRLLARGASVHVAAERPNLTPLQAAAESGGEAVVALLLEAQADLRTETPTRGQPLVLAIKNAQFASALILLGAGADPQPLDPVTGHGIAHLLAEHRRRRIAAGREPDASERALAQALLDRGVPIVEEIALAAPGDVPAEADMEVPEPVTVAAAAPEVTEPRPEARTLRRSDGTGLGIDRFLSGPWQPVAESERAAFLLRLNPIDGKYPVAAATTEVWWASLPFYDTVQLFRVRDPEWTPATLFVYYLKHDGELFRLNGVSPPIHEVNAKAPIAVSAANVLAYLRFFCFFVRGEEGPFYVAEDPRDPLIPVHDAIDGIFETTLRPATLEGTDEHGRFLCSAVIYYSNAIFIASFAIDPSGMLEMVDDEPIAADLPVRVDAPLA